MKGPGLGSTSQLPNVAHSGHGCLRDRTTTWPSHYSRNVATASGSATVAVASKLAAQPTREWRGHSLVRLEPRGPGPGPGSVDAGKQGVAVPVCESGVCATGVQVCVVG